MHLEEGKCVEIRSAQASIKIILIAIAACSLSGCAARMEIRSGETWILGFSRVATEIRALGKDRIVALKSEQKAPIEFGIEPYGITAGVGITGSASGWIGPVSSRNEFRGSRTYGVWLGTGEMAWRWGLTKYKTGRRGAVTTIRVNTVRGVEMNLRTSEPELRLGYSRTTITQGESTNAYTQIEYETETIIPLVKISEEKPNQ